VLDKTAQRIEKLLGKELPPNAMPADRYMGPDRLIVPVRRTSIEKGRSLQIKVIVLADDVRRVVVRWRPLGADQWRDGSFEHMARSIYRATIPAGAATSPGFEYCFEVNVGDDKMLKYPATAPDLNRSVVVVPGNEEE
jgi:hypothetical protein